MKTSESKDGEEGHSYALDLPYGRIIIPKEFPNARLDVVMRPELYMISRILEEASGALVLWEIRLNP